MKHLYKKYERFFMSAFLIGGFIVDVVTFRYINIQTQFVVLGVYALLAAIAIFYLHNPRIYPKLESKKLLRFFRSATPPALQFFFGALLSSSLLFYWFSGSFSVSWPIVLLVAFFVGGNDVFREQYLRPIVQLPLFFFMLFSFSTLVFPFVFKTIEPWVFYGSGLFAFALMLAYVRDFCQFTNVKAHQRKYLFLSVIAVFVGMNGLYFFRFLPPIPLSLREAGMYKDLIHTGNTYTLTGEPESFIDRLLPGQTIHITEPQTLYVFSSVFAPVSLNTDIYNRWERYDEASRTWDVEGRFSYHLFGGRQEGYRGYSYKTAVIPGKWRVTLETKHNQVLGRVQFTVKQVETLPDSVTIER